MQNSCYICKTILLEDNISVEHILPNALGGRLKSKNLLCKECNSKTGQLFDYTLAEIAVPFIHKFNIKKERGDSQSFIARERSTNKEIIVYPDDTTSELRPQIIRNEDSILVRAHSPKRALQEIEKIKKELALKNMHLGGDLTIKKTVDLNDKKKVTHETSFDSSLIVRAICKIMANFYIYKTNDSGSLEAIIDFLRFDIENLYGWPLNLNIAKQLHEGKPYHILIIKGEQKNKALYGYFEMFGKIGFVALLNGRYTGPNIQLNYTFDPVKAIEINHEYNFSLQVTEIINLIHIKPNSPINHTLD